MKSRTEPTDVRRLDRAAVLTEIQEVTRPCLVVPPQSDTEQRRETVAGMLRALLGETQGDEREALRVMRRLATRMLNESPEGEVTPFTAWQHLVDLARFTQAFLDVESRAR